MTEERLDHFRRRYDEHFNNEIKLTGDMFEAAARGELTKEELKNLAAFVMNHKHYRNTTELAKDPHFSEGLRAITEDIISKAEVLDDH